MRRRRDVAIGGVEEDGFIGEKEIGAAAKLGGIEVRAKVDRDLVVGLFYIGGGPDCQAGDEPRNQQ